MPLPICHEPKYQEMLSKFLREWPLSRVRTMPLTDYTRVSNDSDENFRGSFCYALEQETPVGIGGGNALKFGIYEFRKPTRMPRARQDSRYAWSEELGTTAEEAYAKLRGQIVEVIEATQSADYAKLDASPLRKALKWKLAFLYQNPDTPGIVGCASESALREYFRDSVKSVDSVPASKLHALAMEKGPSRPCLSRIGWALYDAVNEEDEEDRGSNQAAYARSFWNYSYDFEGESDDGINDLQTLLQAGEIRCDWDTGESLAGLSTNEDLGKQQAAALLMAADDESNATDTQAAEDELKKRPSLNFLKMGLSVGEELILVADPTKKVVVTGEKTVRFQGEDTSLSDATRRILGLGYYVAPTPRWSHKGRKLNELYNEANPRKVPSQTALMCWLFAKHMKPGDIVFARKARTQDYVAGVVNGDYRHETGRHRFQHVRGVTWLTHAPVAVPAVSYLITKALTDITKFVKETETLLEALNIDLSKLPEVPSPASAGSGSNSMKIPTNVILYGPPGTGKTFHTKEHAVKLCNGKAPLATLKEDFAKLVADKRVAFVTFHQSYDYSDFIIGFKPVPSSSGMSFEVRKGVLMRLAEEAEKNPHLPYLLIIDEINRGNISKIFGELITLIEADKRRDGDFPIEVTLPCAYQGTDGKETCQFSLPSNLHLLGTMNTADRSIALLDTALRRRFKFERKDPQPDLLHAELEGVNLPRLLNKLNAALVEAFSQDHQIGHAWLPMKFDAKAAGDDLLAAFTDRIIPLLDEWYYDDAEGKEALLTQLTEDGEVTLAALRKFSQS